MNRSFLPLVSVWVGMFLVAVLAAPHVFNALIYAGRVLEWPVLRNLEFERVVTRCVMVGAFLALLATVKMGDVFSWDALGLTRDSSRGRRLLWGFALGVLTMGALYAIGWVFGAYTWRPVPLSKIILKFFTYLLAAALVGFAEELLFRGILFSAIRKVSAWWTAAWVSSLLYALIHFAKPVPPFSTVHGDPLSAVRLIPYMAYQSGTWDQIIPFVFTLFVIGLVLCMLYQKTGSLYLAIGLHAGWVFAMRMPVYFLERMNRERVFWFGAGDEISKSYAVFAMALFILFVLIARSRVALNSPDGETCL